MLHYLSLSKKLGGFAAIAAFLLLSNGCGSGSGLSQSSICNTFLQASLAERTKVTKSLYDQAHGSGPRANNYTVQAAEDFCRSHLPDVIRVTVPFFHEEIAVTEPGQINIETGQPITTSTPATTTPTYPVVQFTADAVGESEPSIRMREEDPNATNEWSYTAQLASITTSPNGFAPGVQTAQGYEMLMVQLRVTSLTTGRIVPTPVGLEAAIVCTGPDSQSWTLMTNVRGYDQGPEAGPSPSLAGIDLGNGQPVAVDTEWLVPADTSIAETKCVLEWGKQHLVLN